MHFSLFNHAEYLLEDRKSPACVPGITIMLCLGKQGTSRLMVLQGCTHGHANTCFTPLFKGHLLTIAGMPGFCLGRLWGDDGDSDQPSPACRASLPGKPDRFTNTSGTRSYLYTCGSIRGSSHLMDTSEEGDLCRGPEQQEAGRLEGLEKVETAGGEAGRQHLPSKIEEFQSYPKGKGQWSGCINHVFQKVPSICIAESELVGDNSRPRTGGRAAAPLSRGS